MQPRLRRRLEKALASFAAVTAVLALCARPCLATSPDLVSSIPKDAVAVLYRAGPDVQSPSRATEGALAAASIIASLAYETGALSKVDPCTRSWLDMIASIPIILDHPHALTLLDIQAKALDEGGHRLAGMQAAILIRTNGKNDAIIRRIQHLLNSHTNSDDTVLTSRTQDGVERFRLTDKRMPEWAEVSWGVVGKDYVIAFGQGAFDRIEEAARDHTKSLQGDPWFTRAFAAVGGQKAALGWYLNVDRLRLTDDKLLAEKIERVKQSLKLADVKRGVWSVRYEGRAVEIDGLVRRGDRDVHRPIADSSLLKVISNPDDPASIIPEEAKHFAVIDCDPAGLLDAICAGYLTARSPDGRESALAFWRDVQTRAGVSIDEDIVSHLGRYVVVHNHPRHALGLPLMWTILFRVEKDPEGLRNHIDRLLKFAQTELADGGAVTLHQDPDGVWFMQMGIQGPGLVVTERWVVVSFSPQAVRLNAERFKTKKPEVAGK